MKTKIPLLALLFNLVTTAQDRTLDTTFGTGISFVKVDKLKTANLYTDDSNNFFFTDPNYQIQYEKVYKPSCFIGITYNLF